MRLVGMLVLNGCLGATAASADINAGTYKSVFVPGVQQCNPGTTKTDLGTYLLVVEEACEGNVTKAQAKCTARDRAHVTVYMRITTGPAGQKIESWEEQTCLKYKD